MPMLMMDEEEEYLSQFRDLTGTDERTVAGVTELARQGGYTWDRATRQWEEPVEEPRESDFMQQVIQDVLPETMQPETIQPEAIQPEATQPGAVQPRQPETKPGSDFMQQVIQDVLPESLKAGGIIGGVPAAPQGGEEPGSFTDGSFADKVIRDVFPEILKAEGGRLPGERQPVIPIERPGEQEPSLSLGRLGQQAYRGGARGFADIANFLKVIQERKDPEISRPGLPSPEETAHLQKWRESKFTKDETPTHEEMREERLNFRRKKQQERMQKLEKFAKAMPDYLPGSSGIIEEAVKGMSRFLPTMAISAVNPIAGTALTFAQIMGGKYEELIHQGVDRERAYDAAIFSALAQTPLEMAGNLIQIGALKHLAKTFGVKGISRRLLTLFEGIGKGTVVEGAEEFLQQYPDEAADIYAAHPDATTKELGELFVKRHGEILGRAYQAGKVGAVGGALLGGVGGTVIQGSSLLKEVVKPKPLTGEGVAKQINKKMPGQDLKYDGPQDWGVPGEQALHQFTPQTGPVEGATLLTKTANVKEVREKLEEKIKLFRGEEVTITTPEGRQATRKPVIGIPDGYVQTDVETGRQTVHLPDLESIVSKPTIEKGSKAAVQEVRMKIREQLESTGQKVDMSKIIPTEDEEIAVYLDLVRGDATAAVEDSPLDKASTTFINTGRLGDFIDGLPSIGDIQPHEVFKYDENAKKWIAEFPAQGQYTTTGGKKYRAAKKQAELRGEKIAPIDKWLARNFPKGVVKKPGIRKSGHYALKDFYDTVAGIKDIGPAEVHVADPTRLIQRIDQGKFGGPVQQYVLWPTRSAIIARGTWVDKIKSQFERNFEKLNITKPIWKQWGDKDTEIVTDVLEQISTEDSKIPIEGLLELPKIQKILGKMGKVDQKRITQAAQDSRVLFDELIETQNAARRKRGMKKIEYRGNYIPEIQKATTWSRIFGSKVDTMSQEGVADFIYPNQPFNPRAETREGSGDYMKERNITKLMMSYIDTAARDIFNSAIIENNKIYSKALRAQGKTNSANAIDQWTAEVFAGKDPWFSKQAKIFPRIRESILWRRKQLTRAVFPLNFRWNIFTQTNSIGLTYMRYGVKSMWAGLNYFTDKPMREGIKKFSYSAIIKSHWAGKASQQDIQSNILKYEGLERGAIDTVTDWMNTFTNGLENALTGYSIAAASHYGRTKLGLKGRKLQEFATEGGAKTQSMYNYEDSPGLLRNREIGA